MQILDPNLYALNITDMVDMLSDSYISLIKNDIPLSQFPSVMLWGPPGVGKSQGVNQMAKRIEVGTRKKVNVHDVRLLLFNPVDLRGIPTVNEERTLSVWLKPKVFQMDADEDIINILLLDEISAATPSVQAAAYQITLDRTIGEHKLPDNCIVIAAGNRITDRSVVYAMPKALANRLCHIEIRSDSHSWHKWAVRNGIHKYVTGYIEYNSIELFKFDSSGTDLAFPTPRSWEMVSNILINISDDMSKVFPMIVGCLGDKTARSFRTWTELYSKLPDMNRIRTGDCTFHTSENEGLLALQSEITYYAKHHPDKEFIDGSIKYSCKLPWIFRKRLMLDSEELKEVRPILEINEIYQDGLRNGIE